MGLMKEFKEFAIKGNVLDLAVAVVIGAAFGKIVSSFVDDILMPPIAVAMGNHDLSNYFITLSSGSYATLAEAKAAGAATLNYGLFLNAIVTFLIIAVAVFLLVRSINRMTRKPSEQTTPSLRDCPQCLSAIPMKAVRCSFCTQPV